MFTSLFTCHWQEVQLIIADNGIVKVKCAVLTLLSFDFQTKKKSNMLVSSKAGFQTMRKKKDSFVEIFVPKPNYFCIVHPSPLPHDVLS